MAEKHSQNYSRLLYFAAGINAAVTLFIAVIVNELSLDVSKVSYHSKLYMGIGFAISAILLLIGFIVRSKMYGMEDTGFGDRGKAREAKKTPRSTFIAIAAIVLIIQLALGFFAYNSSKNAEVDLRANSQQTIEKLNSELSSLSSGYTAEFFPNDKFNEIIIKKTLSNYGETVQLRAAVDEKGEVNFFPATIDAYYANKDLEPIYVVDSINTFMKELGSLDYNGAKDIEALAFEPSKTQIELFIDSYKNGTDNKSNKVFSVEEKEANGKKYRVRFVYDLFQGEDSIFEGSDEVHVIYILQGVK